MPQLLARVLSQAWHWLPAAPHWAVVSAVTQRLASQQPFPHEGASQTQTLPEQREPAPHGALVPQRQPPVSQLSAVRLLQLVQVAPLLPQLEVETAVMQVLPWQQPAQVCAQLLVPPPPPPPPVTPPPPAPPPVALPPPVAVPPPVEPPPVPPPLALLTHSPKEQT